MANPRAPFVLQPSEQHVAWRPAGSLRGFGMTTGRIWLTTQRLVFQPVVLWVFWLAPLVGLILFLVNRAHRVELPLATIAAHGRSKFGRNPNVLVLRTQAGVEHRFIIDDFAAFSTPLTAQPAFRAQLLAS
jgi:hypothetical protein